MGTNLYVGNVSFDATEGDLLGLFEKSGKVVQCNLILDKFTNKPRGFAFVEMGTQEESDKAMADLDGKDFLGRALKVNEARPKTDRPPRSRDGGGGGGYGRDRR